MEHRWMENGSKMKELHEGYSWFMLFFGFWVPLFRGDWIAFALAFVYTIVLRIVIHLVLSGIVHYVSFAEFFVIALILGFGAWAVPAVKYNRWYTDRLLAKGWVIVSKSSKQGDAEANRVAEESVAEETSICNLTNNPNPTQEITHV